VCACCGNGLRRSEAERDNTKRSQGVSALSDYVVAQTCAPFGCDEREHGEVVSGSKRI